MMGRVKRAVLEKWTGTKSSSWSSLVNTKELGFTSKCVILVDMKIVLTCRWHHQGARFLKNLHHWICLHCWKWDSGDVAVLQRKCLQNKVPRTVLVQQLNNMFYPFSLFIRNIERVSKALLNVKASEYKWNRSGWRRLFRSLWGVTVDKHLVSLAPVTPLPYMLLVQNSRILSRHGLTLHTVSLTFCTSKRRPLWLEAYAFSVAEYSYY